MDFLNVVVDMAAAEEAAAYVLSAAASEAAAVNRERNRARAAALRINWDEIDSASQLTAKRAQEELLSS